MKKLSRDEVQKKLREGQPLFLVDDIDEIAYDCTNYPLLRVKCKGCEIFERNEARTNSETRAWMSCLSITAEEFEKY